MRTLIERLRYAWWVMQGYSVIYPDHEEVETEEEMDWTPETVIECSLEEGKSIEVIGKAGAGKDVVGLSIYDEETDETAYVLITPAEARQLVAGVSQSADISDDTPLLVDADPSEYLEQWASETATEDVEEKDD